VKRWLIATLGGAALYVVLLARWDAWTCLQGLGAGLLACWVSGSAAGKAEGSGGAAPRRLPVAPWRLVRHLPGVAWQVLAGGWRVALVAVGLRPLPRGGLVEVPLAGAPAAMDPVVAALLETLSPGAFLVELDEQRQVVVFHAFDLNDAAELRRRHLRFLGLDRTGAAGERR
jgi:multisubunit Na+/H+ antiporter MnhE subunit